MKATKIDTSWTLCEGTKEEIKALSEFLKVEIPGAQFDRLVKIGVKSKYKSFVRLSKANPEQCVIYSGLLEILGTFGLTAYEKKTDWSSEEVQSYIDSVELPFEPRDYQKRNVLLALTKGVMLFKAATSSGKSLTISLILEFFRRKSLKGVLIVPNINLLTQFKSDIELYGLKELADQVEINGAGNKSSFEKTVTITTWQSMMEHRFSMKELGLDFLICDECLHPETRITTIDGDKFIKDVKKNDLVLTYNEATNAYEYKNVVEVHKNLNKSKNEKIYDIELENGNVITITGNHPVFTQRGWVRTDQLTLEDDILGLPNEL